MEIVEWHDTAKISIGKGRLTLSEPVGALPLDEYGDTGELPDFRRLRFSDGSSSLELPDIHEIFDIVKAQGVSVSDIARIAPHALATCLWNHRHEGRILDASIEFDVRLNELPRQFDVEPNSLAPTLVGSQLLFFVWDFRPSKRIRQMLRVVCDLKNLEFAVSELPIRKQRA